MDEARCCVCHRSFPPAQTERLGARVFCRADHARALEATRASWSRAGLIETGLVAAFVAVVASTLGGGEAGTLPTSVGTGLVLALVPALIYMVYVYRQDRLEPEPWGLVLGVFVLGGLLGGGVATPLLDDVLRVPEWQHRSALAEVVASVCVVATVQQLCTYLAVRYTVYLTDEFDEAVDGVIYVSAAGLGMATVLNVQFVVDSDGVLPLAGATAIASSTLIHVASAAILGYGLGRDRFSPRGQPWLAGCFVLAVVVHGGLRQLVVLAGTDGATFRPWVALAVSLGLGASVLVGSHLLTAKLRRETLKGGPLAAV